MNKILNNDNSKPPRRIDTAGCRSSLKDGPTINKEEAKRNRKERRDGLSRRVLSTLCPGWTALATVCPGHATALWEITGPRHTRSYRDKNGFVSDALVEKEVIPEVLNELICIEGRL